MPMPSHVSHMFLCINVLELVGAPNAVNVDVDVDNQYIATPASHTLNSKRLESESRSVMQIFEHVDPLNRLRCYPSLQHPQMHVYSDIHHVHLDDLDLLKTPEPPVTVCCLLSTL
jgi:hypothetical protein